MGSQLFSTQELLLFYVARQERDMKKERRKEEGGENRCKLIRENVFI